MKYKMVIFDFDGTLADSFPWFADNINKAAQMFRFRSVRKEEHDILRQLNPKEIMAHLGIKWWKVPFISMYMRKLMSIDLERIQLFENIDILLEQLKKKNLSLALVSSNSRENVEKVLGEKSSYFSYFECGSSIFGKPKKFGQLLKKTGLKSDEVLCIGDEIRDIEAARSHKLHAGSVTWGYAKTEALKQRRPHYIFSDVNEILAIVD